MLKLKQTAVALTAACALATLSLPASAGHMGGHMGGGFGHGGHFGGGHFAGNFGHGGGGHWHGGHGWRGRGFAYGFYPGFAFYGGGPYYDDYYDDDYGYDYCYWRHGRRFCRY